VAAGLPCSCEPRAGAPRFHLDVGCAMSLKRGLFAAIIAAMIVPLLRSLASAQAGGVPVTVGSPPGPFPQNKQNEPAVAIDPSICSRISCPNTRISQ